MAAKRAKKREQISTHSRPKAAGSRQPVPCGLWSYFNSQPPEGGWLDGFSIPRRQPQFQLTAARRRLVGR